MHADRPLVCRIHPSGRHINPEDKETLLELESHPEKEGEHDAQGTVGDCLESQGAPYLKAARLYLNLFRKIVDLLFETVAVNGAASGSAVNVVKQSQKTGEPMKKPNSQSFQKTMVLAATVAALGASLGVPVEQALAAEGGAGETRSTGVTQLKTEVIRHKTQKWGATQEKWKTKTMLNPQPLPPGFQSPYHPGPVELNPQPLPPGAK